jgi:hypothetical protein
VGGWKEGENDHVFDASLLSKAATTTMPVSAVIIVDIMSLRKCIDEIKRYCAGESVILFFIFLSLLLSALPSLVTWGRRDRW